jgi:hypothetical protein
MSTRRKAKAQRTLWEGIVDLDVRALWESLMLEADRLLGDEGRERRRWVVSVAASRFYQRSVAFEKDQLGALGSQHRGRILLRQQKRVTRKGSP